MMANQQQQLQQTVFVSTSMPHKHQQLYQQPYQQPYQQMYQQQYNKNYNYNGWMQNVWDAVPKYQTAAMSRQPFDNDSGSGDGSQWCLFDRYEEKMGKHLA